MTTYFFLLGRTPQLSLQELQAVLPGQTITLVQPNIAMVELTSDEVARKTFSLLGGSIKLFKEVGTFQNLAETDLISYISAFFAEFPNPTFALADFRDRQKAGIELSTIKSALRERNVKSRFIEGDREGLSASVLLHQSVTELAVIESDKTTYFGQTLDVQNIDDWTVRDREKPYANRRKGMLPPKLARSLVNIAISGLPETTTIYDPFCGTGTILLEAMMRGYRVIGSDLDQEAVAGAERNAQWLVQQYHLKSQATFVVGDVAAVRLPDNKHVGAIVTEPFLGKQTPQPAQLEGMFKGLSKLYLGAFKHWVNLLQPNAHVVVIFPFVQLDTKHTYSLEGMIDKLHQLGYTPLSKPVLYARPNATVQRQIWHFQYTPNQK